MTLIKKGIGRKLFFYLMLISIFPMGIIGFMAFKNGERIIKDGAFEHLNSVTLLKSHEIEQWIANRVDLLESVAEFTEPELTKWLEITQNEGSKRDQGDEEFRIRYENLTQTEEKFTEIFLMNPSSGKIDFSTDLKQHDKWRGNRDYFKEGKEGVFVQNVYYSNSLQGQTMVISLPVKSEEGELIGVLAGRVNPEKIDTVLKEDVGLGKTGRTYLVNKFNYLVSQADTTNESSLKSAYSPGIRDCLRKNNGYGLYDSYQGTPVIGAYKWIASSQICILAEISQSEAFASVDYFNNVLLALLALIGISVTLISGLFSQSISVPIGKLMQSAQRIASGRLETKIPKTNQEDEIGQLSESFSVMTGKLVSSFKEIDRLFKVIPDPIFVLELDGSVRFSNPAGLDLIKQSKEKLQGNLLCPMLDCNESKTQKCTLISGLIKRPLNDFRTNLKVNKMKIPVVLSGTALKEDDGSISGFLIVIKDLRELRRYAKQRVDALAPLFHKISLGDFSERMEIPEEEDEFSDLLVAADLMSLNLQGVLEENDRKTQQLQKSQRNLKEAKKATDEEKNKLQSMISNMGEGLIAIDPKGEVTLVNEAAKNILSIERDFTKSIYEEITNSGIKVVDKDDEVLEMQAWPIYKALSTGKEQSGRMGYLIEKHPTLWLDISASPIYSKGKIVGAVSVFRDVTKLQEVEKIKNEFVSLASHQLRTPLTSIKWILQKALGKDQKISKWQKEFLADALNSTHRMIGLVNDLLNVSRLEAGVLNVRPKQVKVNDFIENIVKESTALAKEKRQKIDYKKPKTDITAYMDPQLINQVVSNLLSNALHYSNSMTTVKITLKKVGKYFEIAVKDQGMGISKGDQKKLFDKFFRSTEATRRSTTGSGLGLYVIKKILEVCKGHIKVQSKLDKGTTFTVYVPVKGPAYKGTKNLA